MTVIDCHQHFWIFGKREHKFPPRVGARLDRDYTPEDLRPQLEAAGVDRTILVQVQNAVDETYEISAGLVLIVASGLGIMPPSTNVCAAGAPKTSFADDILPLLKWRCGSCH